MQNSQSSLTLKILTSTLYSVLVEPCIETCCFTARQHFVRRARPMVGNLRPRFHLSCNTTASCQHLFFKAGNHSSKIQVFSDSIHNNTSVSKPCPRKLYKATPEMSFSGALLCGLCKGRSWIHTHTCSTKIHHSEGGTLGSI